MNKFKKGDEVLQLIGNPDEILFTARDVPPQKGIIEDVTPKMYKIRVENGYKMLKIENVNQNYCHYSDNRLKKLSALWNELREVWGKLSAEKIKFYQEDSR